MKAGKNQVKVAETTGSRPRLNRLGALNLHRTEDTVLREDPGINAENIAYFVGARRETDPLSQKIPIILDNAGYPWAECVKDIAYGRNIELHYLPPDSPNLNPIERLWKYMNEPVRNNVYFPDAQTFRETLRHFFHVMLPEKATELTTRLTDHFQILKPASSG